MGTTLSVGQSNASEQSRNASVPLAPSQSQIPSQGPSPTTTTATAAGTTSEKPILHTDRRPLHDGPMPPPLSPPPPKGHDPRRRDSINVFTNAECTSLSRLSTCIPLSDPEIASMDNVLSSLDVSKMLALASTLCSCSYSSASMMTAANESVAADALDRSGAGSVFHVAQQLSRSAIPIAVQRFTVHKSHWRLVWREMVTAVDGKRASAGGWCMLVSLAIENGWWKHICCENLTVASRPDTSISGTNKDSALTLDDLDNGNLFRNELEWFFISQIHGKSSDHPLRSVVLLSLLFRDDSFMQFLITSPGIVQKMHAVMVSSAFPAYSPLLFVCLTYLPATVADSFAASPSELNPQDSTTGYVNLFYDRSAVSRALAFALRADSSEDCALFSLLLDSFSAALQREIAFVGIRQDKWSASESAFGLYRGIQKFGSGRSTEDSFLNKFLPPAVSQWSSTVTDQVSSASWIPKMPSLPSIPFLSFRSAPNTTATTTHARPSSSATSGPSSSSLSSSSSSASSAAASLATSSKISISISLLHAHAMTLYCFLVHCRSFRTYAFSRSDVSQRLVLPVLKLLSVACFRTSTICGDAKTLNSASNHGAEASKSTSVRSLEHERASLLSLSHTLVLSLLVISEDDPLLEYLGSSYIKKSDLTGRWLPQPLERSRVQVSVLSVMISILCRVVFATIEGLYSTSTLLSNRDESGDEQQSMGDEEWELFANSLAVMVNIAPHCSKLHPSVANSLVRLLCVLARWASAYCDKRGSSLPGSPANSQKRQSPRSQLPRSSSFENRNLPVAEHLIDGSEDSAFKQLVSVTNMACVVVCGLVLNRPERNLDVIATLVSLQTDPVLNAVHQVGNRPSPDSSLMNNLHLVLPRALSVKMLSKVIDHFSKCLVDAGVEFDSNESVLRALERGATKFRPVADTRLAAERFRYQEDPDAPEFFAPIIWDWVFREIGPFLFPEDPPALRPVVGNHDHV
eukprot:ANDGO_08164.mRNA.1 hypothetical protein